MRTPLQLIKSLLWKLYYYYCPDKIYLNRRFREVFNRDRDWKNPTTYNEKLQWLKVYDRKPLYTKLVDKYEVRKFVAERIGEQYLIPLLGVWDHFDDIDFDKLPDQFVLKCTHDSNSVVVCHNKASFDVEAARKRLNEHLKMNFYYNAREWPYKNVKPRIIAEKYMEDQATKELRDYKFFAFDGIVRALFIASDRLDTERDTKFDFFDVGFTPIDLRHGHPNSAKLPQKPECYEKMVELACQISDGFPELRVDFYEVNGRVFFGEITLFHHSGFVPFEPEEWDAVFGSWIKLPGNMGTKE